MRFAFSYFNCARSSAEISSVRLDRVARKKSRADFSFDATITPEFNRPVRPWAIATAPVRSTRASSAGADGDTLQSASTKITVVNPASSALSRSGTFNQALSAGSMPRSGRLTAQYVYPYFAQYAFCDRRQDRYMYQKPLWAMVNIKTFDWGMPAFSILRTSSWSASCSRSPRRRGRVRRSSSISDVRPSSPSRPPPALACGGARRGCGWTLAPCSAVSSTGRWLGCEPVARPRIFGIGLNKTGTTSLTRAAELLGLRAVHHGRRNDHRIERAIAAGKPMFRYSLPRVRRADALFDFRSIERHFDVADREFPGSRFILSTRDKEEWLASRERHVRRNQEAAARGGYDGGFLTVDRDAWSRQWDAHHERVLQHFAGRNDLLVIDVTAGDGWEKLAPFLGRPVPDLPFPARNQYPA
jgi:hypothetical protein